QMHRWWAATACPGQYLGSMFPYIAEKINAALIDPDEPQGKVMYCVQVGAFTKYQNAVNMRKTLADKGFSGYITKDAASSLYRVQIGAFSVKANASNYALELSTKGFDCYVKEKEITK
ncbi:MAG: SPOR domain-containing protein, partial [Solobacterium sp.]|nr:SPOR domain-containing protein [Solobacterium sp.]